MMIKGLLIAQGQLDNRFKYVEEYAKEINNWAHCDLFCSSLKNLDESYYLIDTNVLVINPTILYNSFKQISSKFDLIHLPRSKFMKLIRESEFYIEERNAMRFKSFNTSAILIKL